LTSLIAGAHGDLGIPDSSVKLAEWPHRLPEVGGRLSREVNDSLNIIIISS
jgi:hypothetical protein